VQTPEPVSISSNALTCPSTGLRRSLDAVIATKALRASQDLRIIGPAEHGLGFL